MYTRLSLMRRPNENANPFRHSFNFCLYPLGLRVTAFDVRRGAVARGRNTGRDVDFGVLAAASEWD
jgi:hypothetical protein